MTSRDDQIDRSSVAYAEEVMSSICPDTELRKAVLHCLLDSIEMVERAAPGAWAVTLFPLGFRLNVGSVEAFTCDYIGWPFPSEESDPPAIRILALGDLPREIINADAEGTSALEITQADYKSVAKPQRVVCVSTNDPIQLRQYFSLATEAHQRYLASALKTPTGKTRTTTRFKRSHSQGLIDYARAVCVRDGQLLTGQPRDEAASEETYTEYLEGRPVSFLTTRYERDKNARRACIAHHGYACAACGFDFGVVYGEIAAHYIQVHHLNPVAALGQVTAVDPVTDMRPLCANCHAVVHLKHPPYTIEQVKSFIAKECKS